MTVEWIDGFEIKANVENNEIIISANREGMLSLAKHLTALADGVPGNERKISTVNSVPNIWTDPSCPQNVSFRKCADQFR